MKRRAQKKNSNGTRWSVDEDRVVQKFYPDYDAMKRYLIKRSYYAIRNRARSLGIASARHIWTNHDVARLRRLYRQGVTSAQIKAAFPDLSHCEISSKANHVHLVRTQGEPYILGIPPLDDIRKKAKLRGWTLRKLDKIAKTRRYFQQTTRRIDWEHLAKAIKKLEGSIKIEWLADSR
jgi:hypothetical protein